MIQCRACKIEKRDNEFHWRIVGKKRQYMCKKCKSEYNREHYINNYDMYLEKAHRNNIAFSRRNKKKFYLWLIEQECVICGEGDPVVLDMHHRDPSDKEIPFNKMLQNSSIKRIFSELEKCDVLCANCHRRVHYEMDKDGYRVKK